MTLNNINCRRKSIRLPNRNYAGNGYYFVTICTHQKICYFGNIINHQMQLSSIGKIAQRFWLEISQHSKSTYLDEYIIMPNHLHGIIALDNPDNPCRDVTCRRRRSAANVPTPNHDYDLSQIMSELSPQSGSLSTIVRSYKSSVTRWCKQNGFNNFAWQPRFYEHIIRNDGSLDKIREYIVNNPIKWSEDENNPNILSLKSKEKKFFNNSNYQ
ncbi:transposase [Pleurocapsales cyanobacterium LEGE 06147]|nr:transposase [Pleurocapsales cyanobacterium LEGE 06147]